jgi:hypothetical protein
MEWPVHRQKGGTEMSGETLTLGSLIFKKGTPELTKLHTLDELAAAIEVDTSEIKYDIVSGKWSFQSLNWQSHVGREGIETFLESWKGSVKKFVCSIHHLNDPDEINYTEEA